MSTVQVPAQYPRGQGAKMAFVGEAPSDEEVEKGIPLVGPSGRVFDALLRTAGLDRAEFLVTNVFSEQLPGNDLSAWLAPAAEAKDQGFDDLPSVGKLGYLRPQYRWHLQRLKEEIEDVAPDIIVPMGATALWAFTGLHNISSHRGSVVGAGHIVPSRKLLPTYHPAHVIHQWKYFPVVVADMIRARRQADITGIVLPERRLYLEPTMQDIISYVPKLLQSDLLSVDIETGWGQITSIGFAPSQFEAMVIPFVDKREADRNYWRTDADELAAWDIVRGLMESSTPKLGQNFAGYDAYWFLKRMNIEPRNLLHDTRLMHHVLYPELPKDLEFMGASYTEQGAWKSWARHGEKRDA